MRKTLARRVLEIKDSQYRKGPVVYWMSRDQRVNDNWALYYSQEMARKNDTELCVVFCMTPEYLGATIRQYSFMSKGLQEVENNLGALGIGFKLLEGYPWVEFPSFLNEIGAGMLVTDFNPLWIDRKWKRDVASEVDIPMHEVDAHNIVPCRMMGSRRINTYDTFRLRIRPLIGAFLDEFPIMQKTMRTWSKTNDATDWRGALSRLSVDRTVKEVDKILPGEENAKEALRVFCEEALQNYPENAMNPVVGGQSDLSPYIHFGQISAQRVALEVGRSAASKEAKENFLEQLVVKRELSDNFCLHVPNCETSGAFPIWARRSLDEHRSDPREHLYSLQDFETAETHDPLWNAAQTELVKIGKIHGSLRAYWAEKILEWTKSPEQALYIAQYLSNRYGLDANDPSTYSNIAMIIGGLYGRPWRTKEVVGKVRRLTYTQERLSYDIHEYYEKVKKL